MGLTKLAIARPVVILMAFMVLIVLGLKSHSRMPVDLYPRVDIPSIIITTVYPGAGPEETETLVSKPLEEAVGSVNGMKNIMSDSEEGFSVVAIEFELGTNLDTALSDVRSKVDSAKMLLPQDAKSPAVQKLDIGSMPVLWLGMSSKRPARELRALADDVVKDRLSRLKGVAGVQISGGDKREIQVNVDKNRLEAYGLSIDQITQALAMANLNVPSGRVTEGRRDYSVRAVGEFNSVDEIRNLRMYMPTMMGDRVLTIGDMAEVKDTSADREQSTRLQRQDSVGILITKQSDANTVEVAEAVKAELKAMSDVLPADVKVAVSYDQSERVRESLNDVNLSLILGALLAVLIVFLFLHNIRGTFIVAIAIPTSIIATFIPIYFGGFTMNMLVMLGLSLSVGILVDDSIVVLENIYRHLAKGETPVEAAINGRSEIGLAAITITLVDVVVFLPIAFMGGIVGMFFREFGITVAVATLVSLLVSFTLTPMLASRWYEQDTECKMQNAKCKMQNADRMGMTGVRKPGHFARLDAFYNALDVRYRLLLHWALRHRAWVAVVGFGLLVDVILSFARPMILEWIGLNPLIAAGIGIALAIAGVLACVRFRRITSKPQWLIPAAAFGLVLFAIFMEMPSLGFEFAPRVDSAQVIATIEMPVGTSLSATDTVVKQVENACAGIPEVESIFTTVGATTASFGNIGETGMNYGQVSAALTQKESVVDRALRFLHIGKTLRLRTDEKIAQEIRDKTARIPGGRISVAVSGGLGNEESPIEIELTGENTKELNSVAQKIKGIVASTDGTLNTDVSWKVGSPEVKGDIDKDKAALLGLSVAQIASALRTSVTGSTDTRYRENGKEYDIRVRLREFDRYSLSDVGRLVVAPKDGNPVYLQDVAKITSGSGPTKIERKNRQRKISVTADIAPGYYVGNLQQQLAVKLAGVPLGSVRLHWAGQVEQLNEAGWNMAGALILSILLVYMLMAALFESFLSPFVIILSVPMALVGAILALALTGESMSMVSMIGIIMLMGLVTKNAILLVDYTNTLRQRGMDRDAAILEAGPTRLRPILMTTLAMIFGMMPTALKLGRGSELRAPMAICVIGGLIVSTLLTLVMIPTLYATLDDLVTRRRRK